MKTTLDQLYPDIWEQIFIYLNAMELFTSIFHVTRAADEILFNDNYHFCIRGLILDDFMQTLPKEFPLTRLISLELYQQSCLDIIPQCLRLRSLKLIGEPEWIINLLEQVSHVNIKLEQLIIVVPGVGFLRNLLVSVALLSSLHRLEIDANQLEEELPTDTLSIKSTNITQFRLHSCSSISWNDLSYVLLAMSNIYFLDVVLSHHKRNLIPSFIFPKLRRACLTLLEVPFECIIQLVATTPSLEKLKLNGLVDGEGFVNNQGWINLFKSCYSLLVVTVDVSLEDNTYFFYNELIQMSLHEINLGLRCIDDDYDCYSSGHSYQRWWKLSGKITRHGNRL